jgi:hypothetical protein
MRQAVVAASSGGGGGGGGDGDGEGGGGGGGVGGGDGDGDGDGEDDGGGGGGDDEDKDEDEDKLVQNFFKENKAKRSSAHAAVPPSPKRQAVVAASSGKTLVGQTVYAYLEEKDKNYVYKATIVSAEETMCTLNWEEEEHETSRLPADKLFFVAPSLASSASQMEVGDVVSAEHVDAQRYLAHLRSPLVTRGGKAGHLIRWCDTPCRDDFNFNSSIMKSCMWRRLSAKKMRAGAGLNTDVVEHSDVHVDKLAQWLRSERRKSRSSIVKSTPGEQPKGGGGEGGGGATHTAYPLTLHVVRGLYVSYRVCSNLESPNTYLLFVCVQENLSTGRWTRNTWKVCNV